jgi:hypothetical protein
VVKTIRATDPDEAENVISEAILLPAGLLVAVGERGVRLLAPGGDETARWNVRASSLTIADDGTKALIIDRGADRVHAAST